MMESTARRPRSDEADAAASAGPPPKRARRAERTSSPTAATSTEWGGEKANSLLHKHGNYDTTASAEGAHNVWADPRITGLPAAYFDNASVLDVGCGPGVQCIRIAEAFNPRAVLGVDIDGSLITRARQLVRQRQLVAASGLLSATSSLPLSQRLLLGMAGDGASDSASASAATTSAPSHLERVAFRCEDFVGSGDLADHPRGGYNIILLLSVAKWVHLNSGDEGIFRLFRRAHSLLAPGGRLLLQAQPWSSYARSSRASIDIMGTYQAIRLRPDRFPAFLLDRVGFSVLECVISPGGGAGSGSGGGRGGGKRPTPILVFKK